MKPQIAIVGMACRFPDAANVRDLWSNILGRRASFQPLQRQRWNHRRFYSSSARDLNRTYVETAAMLEDIDLFAGAHFGVAPRRAEVMDPQQRLLLELLQQALEDAGAVEGQWDRGRTATFIGASVCEYKELHLSVLRAPMLAGGEMGTAPAEAHPQTWTDRVEAARAFSFSGCLVNMAASVLAQTFDLGGPVYTIDAACASSLLAIHRGLEYLQGLPISSGPAPLAIAGGVYLNLLPDNLVGFARLGAMARRECRPFDAQANGFIQGEGAGLVILKHLEAALRDGDRIYAVLCGGAANCDGHGDSPMTPRLEGQVALLKAGLADSGFEPDSLGYVECHGTATVVGDAIELKSLAQALDRSEPLSIGSIKANIGHCMSAAGVAGLLRAALAVYHQTLPPQAGFDRWHPGLESWRNQFSIGIEAKPWEGPRRRALVSSFGFGGTNCLLALESAPPVAPLQERTPQLFCFSAPTPELLSQYHRAWLEAAADQPLAALAYTQTVTRPRHRWGCVAMAYSLNDLKALPPPRELSEQPLSVHGGTAADRSWLSDHGVKIDEGGLLADLDQPDGRWLALGTARLLGHPVKWGEVFPCRRVANLPPVPLVRERYWVVHPYQPDATMQLVFRSLEALGVSPQGLQPGLRLGLDLQLNPEQRAELLRLLESDFGPPAAARVAQLEEADPTLSQVAEALMRRPQPPPLPWDFPLNLETHPFAAEHSPTGRTLLPLASAMELLAQAQGEEAPFSLEQVEVRRGLLVRDQTRVRVVREGSELRLCELRGEREVIGFTAQAGRGPLTPPEVPPRQELQGPPMSVDSFYRDVAFHGPTLRGIVAIQGMSDTQLSGTLRTSRPQQWIPADPRPDWALDPLLIDGAFQLALYWIHCFREMAGLPVSIQRLLWLRQAQAGEVHVDLYLRESQDNEFLGDIHFHQLGQTLGWMVGARARLQRPQAQSRPNLLAVESLPGYQELQRRRQALREQGVAIPYFQTHEQVRGSHCRIAGRDMVSFSSYNYLGLSGHPAVTAASVAASESYGTSVSASRLVAGERPLHQQLETRLARFLGTEDALVIVSGYLTNVTLISHLMETGDLVLYDALAHDSIQRGARASSATRMAFPHNDLDVLEERLERTRHSYRRVLVVVEGAYSMDGDYPDLPRLAALRQRFQFWLMVDEAHSLGTLGATGRGLGEVCGLARNQVDLWTGTLSKALASCGGYIAGRHQLIDYLKYTVPGFVYSVGMTPGAAAAALAALEILEQEPERVRDLQEKAAYFLEQARSCGLNTGLSGGTPIVPAVVGDSARTLELTRQLDLRGINICPIVFPAVPENAARLRFFVTTLHTHAELRQAALVTAECLESTRVCGH